MKLISVIFGIVLLLEFCSTEAMAGEWFTDAKTNCKVWIENPKPDETVSWLGKCENGFASGTGVLIWHQDEKKEFGRYEGQMEGGKKMVEAPTPGARRANGPATNIAGIISSANRPAKEFIPMRTAANTKAVFLTVNTTVKGLLPVPTAEHSPVVLRTGNLSTLSYYVIRK